MAGTGSTVEEIMVLASIFADRIEYKFITVICYVVSLLMFQ